jgi:hypothetical protein
MYKQVEKDDFAVLLAWLPIENNEIGFALNIIK